MNRSTPGLPVRHQLPEFIQTHVHWIGDVIQPSHPLSSPSPPAFNLSQHQGLFKWVSSASGGQNIGVSASTSVLPMNTKDWSPLGWTGWISLQSKGLSRVFSNTTVPCTVTYILLSLLKLWSTRLLSDLSKISKWMSKGLRFNPNSICLYSFLQDHGTRASTNCGP